MSFSDGMAAAKGAARGFHWREYAPFFLLFLLQLGFLALTTQLHAAWAMSLVAPVAALAGAESSLDYPAFFVRLPITMGWVQSALYAFPGCVLIPLALLRVYSRIDRDRTADAGAGRLAGAVAPTLVAVLLATGAIWGWQRFAAPLAAGPLRSMLGQANGTLAAWVLTLIGGYAIFALLVYIPVVAVRVHASVIPAVGRGVRFGLGVLLPTTIFALGFGLPVILLQFIIERQGAFLITRLRPESMALLLAAYALVGSLASYFVYGAAARLHATTSGDD